MAHYAQSSAFNFKNLRAFKMTCVITYIRKRGKYKQTDKKCFHRYICNSQNQIMDLQGRKNGKCWWRSIELRKL